MDSFFLSFSIFKTRAPIKTLTMALGSYGEAQAITGEVKGIVDPKKAECETKAGKTFDVFEAVSFVKQVVSHKQRT